MTYRQLARMAATGIWIVLVITYQAARYISKARRARAAKRSMRRLRWHGA